MESQHDINMSATHPLLTIQQQIPELLQSIEVQVERHTFWSPRTEIEINEQLDIGAVLLKSIDRKINSYKIWNKRGLSSTPRKDLLKKQIE